MINVPRLYEDFTSEYNTSQLGWYRPIADFLPAVNNVSIDIFNRLAPEAGKDQKIRDWLQPFQKTRNIAVKSIKNIDFASLPEDYQYYSSSRVLLMKTDEKVQSCLEENMPLIDSDGNEINWDDINKDYYSQSITYEEHSVALVQGNRWAAVTKHKTKGPSYTRPYIRQVEGGFEVLPKELGLFVLDYYRLPRQAQLDYDVVKNGADIFYQFKEIKDGDLEWSEALKPIFIFYIGKKYGLTVSNELLLQVNAFDKLFE